MPKLENSNGGLAEQHGRCLGKHQQFDASTQKIRKQIRISGAMMLKDSLAAGDYVLQLIVTDPSGKQTVSQLFPFEIVK